MKGVVGVACLGSKLLTNTERRTAAAVQNRKACSNTYLADSGGKDGEVRPQGQSQGADGVQGISAKLIYTAVQDSKKRMEDVGAVAGQVHAWQQAAAAY